MKVEHIKIKVFRGWAYFWEVLWVSLMASAMLSLVIFAISFFVFMVATRNPLAQLPYGYSLGVLVGTFLVTMIFASIIIYQEQDWHRVEIIHKEGK